MKFYLVTLTILITANVTFSQQIRFLESGTIEFEKRVNTYAIKKKFIENEKNSSGVSEFEEFKKANTQFATSKSVLQFSNNVSLYSPILPKAETSSGLNQLFSSQNLVSTDLKSKSIISQKKAFDEVFLIKDSLRKIDWKITNEEREIAGFQCQRANAIICDSIYVVAFYTTQIPMQGGPESFTGLPGMILGVALPHENISWFATKVTDEHISTPKIVAPKAGKIRSQKDFESALKNATRLWPTSAKSLLISFTL